MSGPTAFRPAYHCETDRGLARDVNEDNHSETMLAEGDDLVLVVADGMGGHAAGEIASRIAVEAIASIAQNSPSPDPRERLRNGFLVANQRIVTEAERRNVHGMGTTAVAAWVRSSGEAFVVHVGDSRLYHVRGDTIAPITRDHTRVQRMVDEGLLTAEAAKTHPDANVVTRALGYSQLADGSALDPEVHAHPLRLHDGDALVLCTDGLYDCVSDGEILAQLGGRTPEQAARCLVELANARGGHDNITVTVLCWGAPRRKSAMATAMRPVTPREVPAAALLKRIQPHRRLIGVGLLSAAVGAVLCMLVIWPWRPSPTASRADGGQVPLPSDAGVVDARPNDGGGQSKRDAGPTRILHPPAVKPQKHSPRPAAPGTAPPPRPQPNSNPKDAGVSGAKDATPGPTQESKQPPGQNTPRPPANSPSNKHTDAGVPPGLPGSKDAAGQRPAPGVKSKDGDEHPDPKKDGGATRSDHGNQPSTGNKKTDPKQKNDSDNHKAAAGLPQNSRRKAARANSKRGKPSLPKTKKQPKKKTKP